MMHLYAIIRDGRGFAVRRIVLNRLLSREIEGLFNEQAESFLDPDLERVEFAGSYSVDESELFVIQNYELDERIVYAIQNPEETEELHLRAGPVGIKSIFAGNYVEDEDSTSAYFQTFTNTRLLRRGFTILQQANAFQRLDDPGFTLDSKLAVAFEGDDLFFKKYATANRVVDITEYFREANDVEVRQVLTHDRFNVEDVDAVLDICDTWMRKRFSSLLESGVMDDVGPRRIRNVARDYGLEFSTTRNGNRDQLVFPTEKREMKKMLTFLNEGYYEGILTGTHYQTNSNRSVDSQGESDE